MNKIAAIEPRCGNSSSAADKILRVGVIGCGHWGKNYVRNFSSLENSTISALCDCDPGKLPPVNGLYPPAKAFGSHDRLLESRLCDAVVVSTIASTHYSITKSALQAGLHVLVEKPLALSLEQADELVELSSKQNRILMVAHTFLFNHGIRTLKRYIDEALLGDIYYVKARRTHLGPIRNDVNVVWDLAPHEIAIILYLLGETPSSVQVLSRNCLQSHREDVAFINLTFPSKIVANITLSWVDPSRERYFDIVGSNARIVFDDLNPRHPIQIFHAGALNRGSRSGELLPARSDATIVTPEIPKEEPMKVLCREFLESIATGECPLSDGKFAREVVAILRQIQTAMHGTLP
jgi:predicted dehydrogenase